MTTTDAQIIRSVTGRMIAELRSGALSAADAPTAGGLTYADGWRCAATLAGLVAADALREAIAAQAAIAPRSPDWQPRE